MTPKEKANELYRRYFKFIYDCGSPYPDTQARGMAIMMVDEILSCKLEDENLDDGSWTHPEEFWQQVKQELQNL